MSSPIGVRGETPAANANAFSAYSMPHNASRKKKQIIFSEVQQYELLIQQFYRGGGCGNCGNCSPGLYATDPLIVCFFHYDASDVQLRMVPSETIWL